MFTQCSILMPTDFSPYALHAMQYALAFAKAFGGAVHFAHVLDNSAFTIGSGHGFWLTQCDVETLMDSMQSHADSRLVHLVRSAEERGVHADAIVVRGKPAPELTRLAESIPCNLIVIATHGRIGFDHLVFGSVCEKIVRQSLVPVLSIKHPERECVADRPRLQIRSILFPTDFSEAARGALPHVAALCRELDANLILCHVCEMPLILPEFLPEAGCSIGTDLEKGALESLDQAREEVGDVTVEVKLKTGIPCREICCCAQEEDVDLIVLPTHGDVGLTHTLFGGTAQNIVRRAHCPVLTIPAQRLGRERSLARAPSIRSRATASCG